MIFLGMMDTNTILITVLLGLSGWTLRTLHVIAVAQAAQKERSDENHERLGRIEERVGELEEKVATLIGKVS